MLARIRKAMEEKEEGFTLIELLVVMIIIGILAAIAIPVFLNQRKKAVDSSMKSDLHTVANEMETYYTDYQAYPAAQTSVSSPITIGTDSVSLSPGDVISYSLNSTGAAYCISVTNPKSSHSWFYVSSQGGLQPATATACPAAANF